MLRIYQKKTDTPGCLKNRSNFFILFLLASVFSFQSSAQNYIVNSNTDANAVNLVTGDAGGGVITLRSAIQAATAQPGAHIITFSGAVVSPINLILGQITVGNAAAGNNISINGPGMGLLTVNQTTDNRVFSTGTGAVTFVLQDITLNSTGPGAVPYSGGGGAIIAGGLGASTTLTNVTISNFDMQIGNGGAMSQSSSLNAHTLTITNCIFINNRCGGAGGAVSFNSQGGTATITGCTFTNNHTGVVGANTGGDGGAVSTTGGGSGGTYLIEKNTFLNNQVENVTGHAGAVMNTNGTLTLRYNRFIGNTCLNVAFPPLANIVGQAGGATTHVTIADNNWWGVNTGPGANDATALAAGAVMTLTKWLQLKTTASPNPICNTTPTTLGNTSTVTTSFLSNSASEAIAVSNLTVLIGLAVTWGPTTLGSLSGQQGTIQAAGTATALFTSNGTGGTATVNTQVDNVPAGETSPARASITVNTTSIAPTGTTGTSTICNGNSTTLTVAGGSKGTAAVTQWFTGSCGGTLVFTGDAFTTSPSSTTTYFVRYNGTCNTTPCATVTVTVNNPSVAPSSISGTTLYCNPGSTTLTAVGGTLGTGANYQWGTGAVVGTSPLAGQTASTLNVSPVTTTTYWVRIENTTAPCTAITGGVTQVVTVNQPSVAPSSITGTTTICNGSNTTLTAVGGTLGTGANYQWGTGAVVGTSPLAGQTASTLNVSPGSTTTYWVRIENTTAPCTAITGGVTQVVTVNDVTGGTVGSDQTICSPGDPAAFTESVASTGSGALTYQWQSNTTSCGAAFTNIAGATSATYDPPSGLTVTTYYRRVTTSTLNTVACTANSNCITVSVNAVTGGTVAADQTICSGGDPAAFTQAVASTGTALTYQWQSSTTNCSTGFADIVGATGTTYDVPAGLTVTTYYRRVTTGTLNSVVCSANSNCITVSVNDVTGGTVAADQTICSGGDPAAFTESAASTGTGTLSYQWQSNTTSCAAAFTNIAGATSATYDAPSGLTQTTYYRRVTTSTLNAVACTANSNCITVTVNSVTGGTVAADQTLCPPGDPAAFTQIVASTGTALTYQWQSSTTDCTTGFSNIGGATGTTYDVPSGLAVTTYYRRVTTSTLNAVLCTANSNCITVTINCNPVMSSSLRDALLVDINGNTIANPNDQLRYTTVIRNNGALDANGVNLNLAAPTNTTLNPGSTKTSALARDDNFTALSNTILNTGNVLTNDYGLPSVSVVSFGTTASLGTTTAAGSAGTTNAGGTLTVNANGTFSYTSPLNFTGTDQFMYIATTLPGGILPNNDAVVTITVLPDILFSTTNVNPTCAGSSTGSITFTAVSGGSGPVYTFSITGAGGTYFASNVFNGLPAATYNLAVKDGAGNIKTGTATLTDPAAITFTFTKTDITCFGAANGSIVFNTTTGGTGPYTYSITGTGGTFFASNSFTPLVANTYTLVVKDATGCNSATQSTTVAEPAAIVVSGTIPNLTYNVAMATATFTKTGGTGSPANPWSASGLPTGVSINTATGAVTGTPLQTGTFNAVITYTDANGCTGTKNVAFDVAPNLQNNTFNVVGNTQLVSNGHSSPATPFTADATNILTNDQADVAITITAVTNAATTGGGTITIDAAGKFTYTPPVGSTAADSYVYTGTANGVSATATINITIANMVWYVNNTNGGAADGRSQSPFTTVNAAATASAINQIIYVHTGAGNTTGNALLKTGQTLRGAGSALTVGALSLAAGTKPTLTGMITLANTVTVDGFDMSTGATTALTSSGATGVNVNIGNVTTTGATNAVTLTNTTGTVSIAGGTLTGGGGAVFNVIGGTATITCAAAINQATAAQRLVNIQSITGGSVTLSGNLSSTGTSTGINVSSCTGGTVTFSGTTKTLNTPTVTPVTLVTNTGATINFTGGGLAVTSTTATGFNATGGATAINVTGTGNTITSTTGIALNVANTTIGTSNLNFQSISASGAPNGMILNNTGSSGGLVVTGTGVTGTGGTIQNSVTHGVVMTSTMSPTLSFMNINDNAGVATDDGMVLTNITGTVTFNGLSVSGSPHNGITFDNFNTNLTAFIMTNSSIACPAGFTCQTGGTTGNDGILIVMRGSSVLTSGLISGSTFSGMRAVAVQVQANDNARIGLASGGVITAPAASNSFTIQNNTFTGNGIGIDMGISQVASMAFQILNNTIVAKVTSPGAIPNQTSSHAINAFTAAGADTGPASHFFVGKIDGNIIGTLGVKDSGSGIGSGIRVVVQGQNTQGVVTVSNNIVREVPNSTILNFIGQNGNAAAGTNSARFKIINNTMPAPSGSNLSLCGPPNSPCGENGIFVLADEGTAVCNIITGNNIFDLSAFGFDIYLAERAGPPAGAQLTVEGTGGSNSAYILANNTLAGPSKFLDEGANTSQVALGGCGAFPLRPAPDNNDKGHVLPIEQDKNLTIDPLKNVIPIKREGDKWVIVPAKKAD